MIGSKFTLSQDFFDVCLFCSFIWYLALTRETYYHVVDIPVDLLLKFRAHSFVFTASGSGVVRAP